MCLCLMYSGLWQLKILVKIRVFAVMFVLRNERDLHENNGHIEIREFCFEKQNDVPFTHESRRFFCIIAK